MNMDFPTILVLATLITGVIWAIDALLFAPRRRRAATDTAPAKEPMLVEISRSFFPVILLVLLLRSFLVEPFRIPSGSMMPTLVAGDFILVNKFTYGIRLPVINKKVIEMGEPKRGDVVVFRYPLDPKTDFIKRVVGLPGDRIRYRDKTLYVNNKPMPQLDLGPYAGKISPYPPGSAARFGQLGQSGPFAQVPRAELKQEDLEGHEHDILVNRQLPDAGMYGVNSDYVVPDGHYFVMGDNRDNSKDSRFWGPMPESNLVGKAFLIWMNWDSVDSWIGWDRIGQSIH